jgi:hypothetical protein
MTDVGLDPRPEIPEDVWLNAPEIRILDERYINPDEDYRIMDLVTGDEVKCVVDMNLVEGWVEVDLRRPNGSSTGKTQRIDGTFMVQRMIPRG